MSVFYCAYNEYLYTLKPFEQCDPVDNAIDFEHCAYQSIEMEIVERELIINSSAKNIPQLESIKTFDVPFDHDEMDKYDIEEEQERFEETIYEHNGHLFAPDDSHLELVEMEFKWINRSIMVTCFKSIEQALSELKYMPENGIFRSWYHSGVQKECTEFKNKLRDGLSVSWDVSGYISSLGNYIKGKRIGWYIKFNNLRIYQQQDAYVSHLTREAIACLYKNSNVIDEYEFHFNESFTTRTLSSINEQIPDDFNSYVEILKDISILYKHTKKKVNYWTEKAFDHGKCVKRQNIIKEAHRNYVTTGKYLDAHRRGYMINGLPCGFWLIDGQIVMPNATNAHLFPNFHNDGLFMFPLIHNQQFIV